jgi:hypothetical protein
MKLDEVAKLTEYSFATPFYRVILAHAFGLVWRGNRCVIAEQT